MAVTARGLVADTRETTRILTRILAIAVVVRASLAISAWLVTRDHTVFYSPDTNSYVTPARELLTRGTFTVRSQPELVRTPGYPLLLVPGIWLGRPEATTITLQVVLSVLTVAGVFVLARLLFDGERVPLIAAALYAVEPLSVLYTSMLLTETLFAFMVVWGLILIVDYIRGGRVTGVLAGPALLAASAYVRPAGLFLPFGLLALLGAHAALGRRWNTVPYIALAAAGALLVVAPWQVRNRALGFRGMSAISAEHMYFYNAAALRAARSGTSFQAAQAAMGYNNDSVYVRLHPEQGAWRPGERFQYMAEEGAREVREDVGRYARMHVAGMARVLFDPGAIDMLKLYRLYPARGGLLDLILTEGLGKGLVHLLRTNPLAVTLLIVFGVVLAATYTLALWGLAAGKHFRDPAMVVLVASAAYFVLIAGGPVGLNRFRHPVMPFVCALAAAGLGGRRCETHLRS